MTRALGCSALVEVDIADYDVLPGDTFLLCTDGLSNLVSGEEMAAVVTGKGYEKAVQELVNRALARGGFDNITVDSGK